VEPRAYSAMITSSCPGYVEEDMVEKREIMEEEAEIIILMLESISLLKCYTQAM